MNKRYRVYLIQVDTSVLRVHSPMLVQERKKLIVLNINCVGQTCLVALQIYARLLC